MTAVPGARPEAREAEFLRGQIGITMHNTYHVFGLSVASAIPLPAYPEPGGGVADIVISYGETPVALKNPVFRGVRFQASPGEFMLRVDSVARYWVQQGNRITITPEAGVGDDDVLVFLMGSAMGALLHQRNVLTLHAAAIAVDGESVVFVGRSGVGKSTLAAGFFRRGYSFLSDDVCAVADHKGRQAVVPGFPRLKLWADALKKMNTDKSQFKSIRVGASLEKYFLPVENGTETAVPVRAVFVLEVTNTERIEIIGVKGGDKLDPIVENTYRMRFLRGLGGKADHFRECAAIAAKAAVYRAVRPGKGFLLDELMDLVEARMRP